MRTVSEILNKLPPGDQSQKQLTAPYYNGTFSNGLALAVESMKRHMTDEGWQIMEGLNFNSYRLAGRRLPIDEVHIGRILRMVEPHNPGVVVVQDKREWDLVARDFRDRSARFEHVEILRERQDLFKLTILKDSHQRPSYHRQSAEEMGVNAWIVYYHPKIVKHLAPYIRPEHVVRTYHTIDPALVPSFSQEERDGCLLSGAVSGAYPLRTKLVRNIELLPGTVRKEHPGYHMKGCCTPDYLKLLSKFKVAICTSSMYGYALRKIIEATACGCVVLTDLPSDEVLPEIDDNLVRIDPNESTNVIGHIVRKLLVNYNPERQRHLAEKAATFYNYRSVCARLVKDIERMRTNYATTAIQSGRSQQSGTLAK